MTVIVHIDNKLNSEYLCSTEKIIGTASTTNYEHCTCVYCLRAVIKGSRQEESFPEVKRCDGCKHLNHDEEVQDKYFKELGERPEHYCNLWITQLFHPAKNIKYIARCSACTVHGDKRAAT